MFAITSFSPLCDVFIIWSIAVIIILNSFVIQF